MTTVVFVHGFMGGSAQWALQLEDLKAFDIVTLDLPGFGKRVLDPALPSIEAYADWALSELSRQGINQFHLVGHSMGGMIAQEMTFRAPERITQLVLYGTGATGVLPGRFETIETSKERAKADGPVATARRISATWFLEGAQAEAYEICASIAQNCSLETMLTGLDAMYDWSGAERLKNIKGRTLILWGDNDRTYTWQQVEHLWRSIDGAHLSVIPKCAHAVHLENPVIFNKTLELFLSSP